MVRERDEHFEDMHRLAANLAYSERGKIALRAIKDLVDGPCGALDEQNQEAVVALLRGCWGEWAGTTREAIEIYLD